MRIIHKALSKFWLGVARLGNAIFQMGSYASYAHNKKASK
jgi:hypothetical protein